MLFCQCRAQDGDNVTNAELVSHDDVGITLNDRHHSRFDNFLTSEIKPIDASAFGEQRRLGAVQILRRIFRTRHHAAAERDDASVFVADRKHQAVAKRVVKTARFARFQ